MIERRSFGVELRADGNRLVGHASVFDLPSEPLGWGGGREMIAPGAFDYALEKVRSGIDHVASIWNHNPDYVIASTRDGSLRLSVDKRGLVADMTPIDTQTIRDLVVKPILDGKVKDMSFGFTVAQDGAHDEKRDGVMYRIIDKIERLFDASPVLFGAYPQTDIAARSLLSALHINPDRLSSQERISFQSFMTSIARHLPEEPTRQMEPDTLCANDYCEHPMSDHPDMGACIHDDGCSSFAMQDEVVSLKVPQPEPAVSQRGSAAAIRSRFTAVSHAQLNRRLHRAEDFALVHGLSPAKGKN